MRKLSSLIAIAAFILNGCSQELKVKTADSITTEYGKELENSKLYDAKESDENVTVKTVDGFDDKKLGEQELTVTFTDGEKETERTIKVKVEDTLKPAIELKKETITITAGDKLTLKDNVKSVSDPVDGELKYSNKEIEKSGYYIDTGKLDADKTGTYEVKVIAYDANGNFSEKTFQVIVKKKETKKETSNVSDSNTNTASSNNTTAPQQPTSSSSNSGDNESTGNSNSSSGNSESNSDSSQANVLCPGGLYPEKACNLPLSDPSVGSDGQVYNTWDEANSAGMDYMLSEMEYGYDCMTVTYNDGSQKWIWVSHKDLGIY